MTRRKFCRKCSNKWLPYSSTQEVHCCVDDVYKYRLNSREFLSNAAIMAAASAAVGTIILTATMAVIESSTTKTDKGACLKECAERCENK